jgi:glycosyltransferase involved in cell wall biosynthesis
MTPGASKIYASIERVLSWLAPKIILVSQYEFRHAEQIGIAKNKLALIPNGITVTFPVTREQARKNLQINDNGIVIGFVGRMEPQKNPIRAIRAFQQIADQFPATQLVMVGDGALRAEMEAVLTDLDLNKRVSLLGQCDARSVIPAFDCLLCSSDFEAMPITFLEALATGIPIVTTPVGGTDEAVFEGLTGFIAKTPSVSDLATALTNFLNFRPEQRQKMAENAHKYSALFTTEIMGERHNELYKECLSRLSLSQ